MRGNSAAPANRASGCLTFAADACGASIRTSGFNAAGGAEFERRAGAGTDCGAGGAIGFVAGARTLTAADSGPPTGWIGSRSFETQPVTIPSGRDSGVPAGSLSKRRLYALWRARLMIVIGGTAMRFVGIVVGDCPVQPSPVAIGFAD